MNRRIADSVISVTTSMDISLFRSWLDFTAPLHNLTNKERAVMAAYLKEHFDLSKVITNDAILAQVLSSTTTKQKIMSACHLTSNNLQVTLHKFKEHNLMIDGRINPKLIPPITQEIEDSGELRLMIRFSIEK